MSDKKKSFVLHLDTLEIVKKLSDDQAGQLLKAFLAFHNSESFDLDQTLDLVFFPFKAQFERDLEKYKKIVERNKNNGSKGGRPQKQDEPKKPTGLFGNPSKPKKADSDKDSDSVSDKDNKSEYAFLGETIRLNHSDFQKWQKLYSNLNLMNELKQLDMECRGDKKWFMTVSSKLNYRNKNAPQIATRAPKAFSQ